MIKYRALDNRIEAVEIIRETTKQIVRRGDFSVGEYRENKVSIWWNWFDTWDEAHEFIVSIAESKVASLCRQLEQANVALGQIRVMKQSSEIPTNHG